MAYSSILDWIQFKDVMSNPFYPYEAYNLPFDISYKLWELLGGPKPDSRMQAERIPTTSR